MSAAGAVRLGMQPLPRAVIRPATGLHVPPAPAVTNALERPLPQVARPVVLRTRAEVIAGSADHVQQIQQRSLLRTTEAGARAGATPSGSTAYAHGLPAVPEGFRAPVLHDGSVDLDRIEQVGDVPSGPRDRRAAGEHAPSAYPPSGVAGPVLRNAAFAGLQSLRPPRAPAPSRAARLRSPQASVGHGYSQPVQPPPMMGPVPATAAQTRHLQRRTAAAAALAQQQATAPTAPTAAGVITGRARTYAQAQENLPTYTASELYQKARDTLAGRAPRYARTVELPGSRRRVADLRDVTITKNRRPGTTAPVRRQIP